MSIKCLIKLQSKPCTCKVSLITLKQIITIKDKILYDIKICEILGGFVKPKQLKILNKYAPEIIIATPGRLWEIIENEESQIFEKMNHLKYFVIDEADRMNESGHFAEFKNIINHIYSKIEIELDDKKDKGEKISDIPKLEEDIKENEEYVGTLSYLFEICLIFK